MSLGNGQCGFKLINSTMSDPTNWLISAEDTSNKLYRSKFTVTYFRECYIFYIYY